MTLKCNGTALLQKHSTNAKTTRISHHLKWLSEIRLCKHGHSDQCLLNLAKSPLTLGSPVPFTRLSQQEIMLTRLE